MFVEFDQGPWGGQALQKILCVSGSFVKDCWVPKFFLLLMCTILRMFVEFCQGLWGGQTLQKIMCVSGNFVKDCWEPKLFVL